MTTVALIRRRGFEPLRENCLRLFRGAVTEVSGVNGDMAVGEDAQVIIVCCDHPDAFRGLMPTLVDAHPLAEILVAASPWLQATGRSRSDWPAAWLYSESEAISRLEAIADGTKSPTPRPVTWTRDERWLVKEA